MADPSARQKQPAPDFGGANAFRREFQAGGRVYVDRPLPFLVLGRHPDINFSLARRIATISAASVVWPATGDADAEAAEGIASILRVLHDDFPNFLLVSLHDLPRDPSLDVESPRLEAFRFTLGASADAAAGAAASRLRGALGALRLDTRDAEVATGTLHTEPGIGALAAGAGVSQLSVGLPQVYRIPGEKRIYPQIYHELETTIYDALLQGITAFVEATTPAPETPRGARHHRSLGRSRYIEAALTADRELARISRSFDFLLGISPINTAQAFDDFESGQRRREPVFRYRPLPINPDTAKRRLYGIDLRAVEDPVLESLFREKQRELDQQLMMLQRRNTPAFRYVSLLQYGAVDAALLEQSQAILAEVRDPVAADGDDATDAAGQVDCHAVLAAADALIARYRHKVPEFKAAKACLREDIGPGLMVSGESLLVSTATRMSAARLDALLQHEVSVHLLTCINGSQQGLGIFGAGLADYEGVQEGLGVFAEFAAGGLDVARLRLLAARVLVVDAMLAGAGFIDCHRLLHADHGFGARGAFNIVARIFRSGGLTKDAIYLRGFNQVLAFVASGRDLDPFWFGKIAEHHVPVVEELHARGILRRPVATPEFLARPSSRNAIARIRDGVPFIDLIRATPTC